MKRQSCAGFVLAEEGRRSHPWVREFQVLVQVVQPFRVPIIENELIQTHSAV